MFEVRTVAIADALHVLVFGEKGVADAYMKLMLASRSKVERFHLPVRSIMPTKKGITALLAAMVLILGARWLPSSAVLSIYGLLWRTWVNVPSHAKVAQL